MKASNLSCTVSEVILWAVSFAYMRQEAVGER